MPSLRVFWGAPTTAELRSIESSSGYTWHETQLATDISDTFSFYENAIKDDSQLPEDDYDMTGYSNDINETRFSAAPRNAAVSFLNSTMGGPGQSYYDETIETQDTFNSCDENSIARFPTFSFSLHSVTPLSALSIRGTAPRKVNVLLAVLEAEGPDGIVIKKGNDAGKEVSVMKLILGDEKGSVCKLTAWREVADTWGSQGVKRGDVVYIQNVTPVLAPNAAAALTASPFLKSTLEICYRSLAYDRDDARYRPDLRLGDSDASVRRVSELVQWFGRMAGMHSPDGRG